MPCRYDDHGSDAERANLNRAIAAEKRVDELTRLLCMALTELQDHVDLGTVSVELEVWKGRHDESDRYMREMEQQREQAHRKRLANRLAVLESQADEIRKELEDELRTSRASPWRSHMRTEEESNE